MDGKQLFPTLEGTPQGGVISPLLANIALHGMEERIKQFAETLPGSKRDNRYKLSLIRYADDFVILHEDITVVQKCREIISEWLKGIGLELKPSKTRIAHTLNQYGQEEPGFDFLVLIYGNSQSENTTRNTALKLSSPQARNAKRYITTKSQS